MLNVFISSFERQSGKTIVAAGLAATMQSLSYSTAYYKPIQTNATMLNEFKTSPDIALIKKIDSNINAYSTYVLKSSHSPFVGAYEDNLKIDVNVFYDEFYKVSTITDCNIVEGANSISTPIAKDFTEIELVKALQIPLVLVVDVLKTPISSVIAYCKYIKVSGVRFSGVILNRYDEKTDNLEHKYYPQILKEFTNVNILGSFPEYENAQSFTPDILIDNTLTNIDIESIFGLKIAKLNS